MTERQTTENPMAEHNRLLQLDRAIPDAERYLQKLRDERSQTTESASPRSECEFDPDHLYHAPQPTNDRICITCGKIGGTCRWSDDAQACMRTQLDELRAQRDRLAEALAFRGGK